MRRAVVDDPEHPPSGAVGLGRHHLGHQPAEGVDAGVLFASAEHLGPVDVPGREVLQGSSPVVLVLDAHRPGGGGGKARVAAAARLDGGLLIGGHNEVVAPQRLAPEAAPVEIEDPPLLGLEAGARGKIQLRWVQGRMASWASQRQMVDPEMDATIPRPITSLAMSETKRRERGTSRVLGSSQARAFTAITTRGGKPSAFLAGESTKLEEQIAPLASLTDPTRRRLYLFAVARPQGMGRDEAATGVGISRALAAFHLDRLVADGLLVADYRRLSGRTGPGAGRPAKIYRRSARELSFSIPRRNYEPLARLLAQALTSTGEAPPESLSRGAHDVGVDGMRSS
jgi:hypothetical protein